MEAELRRRLKAPSEKSFRELIACVERIELDAQAIRIRFRRAAMPRAVLDDAEPDFTNAALAVVNMPIRCRLRGGRSWLEAPEGRGGVVRIRRDPALIHGLQQAHKILAAIGWRADGALENPRAMAAPTSSYDRKLCRLAFLAPDIQKTIIAGRQPRDLSLLRLLNEPIPILWSEQRRKFGFADRL